MTSSGRSKMSKERRATLRLQMPRGYPCRVVIPPDPQAYEAGVYDVSQEGGLGLLLKESVPVGTWLVIQLCDGDAGAGDAFAAQVRHATPGPDDSWLIGCSAAHELTLREEEVLLSALSTVER